MKSGQATLPNSSEACYPKQNKMQIPKNIIANADDFGLNAEVNKGIFKCYENGYINSCSIMSNMPHFEEAVTLCHKHSDLIVNIGVHIDLAEGKPLTSFRETSFLNQEGNWNNTVTGKLFQIFNAQTQHSFSNEIEAQIKRAQDARIKITHLDSHLHLHTLPAFFGLFLAAAKKHKLKLRLAQTYREGSYLKFWYRRFINFKIYNQGLQYADQFETVDRFLGKPHENESDKIEIMFHPTCDQNNKLSDHYEPATIEKWAAFLNKQV